VANTVWKITANNPQDQGLHDWLHRDEAFSVDFDQNFYRLQPRHGLYAASRLDNELTAAAVYPALGSPNWEIPLRPIIGRNIGLFWEMKVDAGTGRIKFYILQGANREILSLKPDGGASVTEATTTSTSYGQKRYVVRDLSDPNIYTTLGDVEGEDATLEIYVQNDAGASTTRIRRMRIVSGMTPFLNNGTTGVNGDYLV
jgi:hypothetical protein